MDFLHEIIQWMQSLSPMWVYGVVFAIAFIENIFPPFPSDVPVVFAGSLIGIGTVGFVETMLVATVGSTLGFMTMYMIGKRFGDKILEKGKIKFIPIETVNKVETWFRKYGYWLIVGNRFLAGTRAVVSFFAGLSEMNLVTTTALSFLSALAWNALLVSAGYSLGKNWERIGFYLSTYSQVVTGLLIVGVLSWVLWLYFKGKKTNA